MTDYSFGDIILVPFPFTDQTTSNGWYLRKKEYVIGRLVWKQSIAEGATRGGGIGFYCRDSGLLEPKREECLFKHCLPWRLEPFLPTRMFRVP